ncbi:4-cresol dehydrogenase [Salinisphaera orenii MK-B5]|uniref:4-cresol dehydrogenase n=1 Tax=Salinisphaera orenii MK-B5 TaxID=856730 RepID=A0A423PPS0_9GAMM|nr:FAD-binding oxidoreductase [Salinisphaera orenii]ROO27614.1 4-cresol dehydrogenase [Salinisphaera orenii MK-B5]
MKQSDRTLPPGVSAADFDSALQKFKDVVGGDNVLIDSDHLAPYTKLMMAGHDRDYIPSAALLATRTEQVQAIVKICNEYGVPIWPISTGKNLGYGSAAPGETGQVMLDLRNMDQIIDVDPEVCTALIEPGVTYQKLYDYIQEAGYKLWLDPPAPSAIAGPVGNTLDRGVGYTPYGEHFMFQCGMEVVLPNGEVVRTGMGGIPNSTSWQVFKWGYGPYIDGLFTQSNYGIVTKMGLWLMPAPPAYRPFLIQYPDPEDIEEIVEIMRPLRISQVIPNAVVIAHTLWDVASHKPRSDFYDGDGTIPREAIDKIKSDEGIGEWNIYAALYGTPEQIEVNWNIIQQAFSKSGKAKIFHGEAAEKASGSFGYRAALMKGEMNLQEFGLYNWRGGGGSMWFAPVSQAKGKETRDQTDLAQEILGKYGFDYVAEYIVGWRDMHHIIDLLYDRQDPEEKERAHACFAELIGEFEKRGYGIYRTNIEFMDRAAQSFGEPLRNIHRTIKDALDPNGIIAPGKSGIRGSV